MEKQIGKDENFINILSRFDEGYHPWIDAGYGWSELINQCHEKLVSFDPNYKVAQIKEKFGGLRYYFNPSNPVYTRLMHDKIIPLERLSYSICEICGENGKLRRAKQNGWLKTLCEQHTAKEIYDDASESIIGPVSPSQLSPSQKPNIDNDSKNLRLYPIVIRESRYGGVYEGGKWHAIANCESLETWNIDYFDYLNGDDDCALDFWNDSAAAKKIGVGATPNDALSDLFRKNFI